MSRASGRPTCSTACAAAYPGAKKLGRGTGYIYPHEDPSGFEVDCLPDELKGTVFYTPSGNGEET